MLAIPFNKICTLSWYVLLLPKDTLGTWLCPRKMSRAQLVISMATPGWLPWSASAGCLALITFLFIQAQSWRSTGIQPYECWALICNKEVTILSERKTSSMEHSMCEAPGEKVPIIPSIQLPADGHPTWCPQLEGRTSAEAAAPHQSFRGVCGRRFLLLNALLQVQVFHPR